MEILVVAATQLELMSLRKRCLDLENIDFLVTGVGIPLTTLRLSQHFQKKASYDIVLNIGVAGSYNYNLSLGDTIQIHKDRFGDLGAEDKNGDLLDLNDLNLNDKLLNGDNGWLSPTMEIPVLTKATSVTLSKGTGSSASIVKMTKKYAPEIESMEGAAFFMTCKAFKLPKYLQIRTISNYVEPRDKSKWNIPLALNELHSEVYKLLSSNFAP